MKKLTDAQYERIVDKLSAMELLDFGFAHRSIDGDAVFFQMGNYAGWLLRSVKDIADARDELYEVRALVCAE